MFSGFFIRTPLVGSLPESQKYDDEYSWELPHTASEASHADLRKPSTDMPKDFSRTNQSFEHDIQMDNYWNDSVQQISLLCCHLIFFYISNDFKCSKQGRAVYIGCEAKHHSRKDGKNLFSSYLGMHGFTISVDCTPPIYNK